MAEFLDAKEWNREVDPDSGRAFYFNVYTTEIRKDVGQIYGGQKESGATSLSSSSATSFNKEVTRLFRSMDTDCDNEITHAEFREALKNPKIRQFFGVRGVNWEPVFDLMDTDHNDKISLKEFSDAMNQSRSGAVIFDPVDMKKRPFGVQVVRLFKHMDTNNDQRISREEFLTALQTSNIREVFTDSGVDWNEVFDDVDLDDNEHISFKEFKAAMNNSTRARRLLRWEPDIQKKQPFGAEVVQMFKYMDSNNDNMVSKAEFRRALQSPKIRDFFHARGVNWADVFDAIDADGDEVISFTEFKAVMQNCSGSAQFKPPSKAQTFTAPAPRAVVSHSVPFLVDATRLFKTIDSNGDGLISKPEFHEALRVRTIRDYFHARGVNWEVVFDLIDTNHDGSITLEEFKAAMEVSVGR